MRKIDLDFMMEVRRRAFAPRFEGSPSDWCVANLWFNEASNHGPFRLTGSEYCRDVIDDFGRAEISDEVLVWGSQSRKTGSLMGGVAWSVVNDPCGILWVLPNEKLAKRFSRQRWQELLRASPATRDLLPVGARRHDFATLEQMVGAAVINFAGSNSAANLASNPCRRVILDEVDKFDTGGREEADAVNLAEQRTKDQPFPQRWKTSTPTLVDGLIWQEFLKGDQRRYFVPCPWCGELVVFAWSEHFTILPKLGCEAYVKWDQKAKRKDRVWDLDLVKATAHAECPHCKGPIRSEHKTAMIRAGVWKPTAQAPSHFVSRHLSSLYAASPETTFGVLAVKFLQSLYSLLGLQGFVNGDLAEPWENQDARTTRVEIISSADAPALPEAAPLMFVDVQATSPFFWFVIREFAPSGASRLRAAGHCDDWETVRAVQLAHEVKDHHVCVDSGDRTEDVYRNCLRWGRAIPRLGLKPQWWGWMPSKGREREAKWIDPKTKEARPFFISPNGAALPPSAPYWLPLFEFNGEFLLDLLARLRKGKTNIPWELREFPCGNEVPGAIMVSEEEYFRHLDSKYYKPFTTGRTQRVEWRWTKRSDRWPDHLLDCEVGLIAWAMLHKRLPLESENPEK